jgi:hypothetical protein
MRIGTLIIIHIVRLGESLFKISKQYCLNCRGRIYYHPDKRDFKHRKQNPSLIHPIDKHFTALNPLNT